MSFLQTPHRGIRSRHDTSVFTKATLTNGITVWIQQSPVLLTAQGILVAYFTHVGNILDPKGKEGLAHFLEHMPFKGTKQFADSERMNQYVSDRGGSMNAATARSTTKYYIEMPERSFPEALEVLSELTIRPLMRPEDIEIERGVIESERQRKFEHSKARAEHDIDQLLFGDHPAVSWGIGSQESIAGITPDDITSFWKQYYHTGNCHLVVGGTFAQQDNLIEQLEKAFADMPQGEPVQVALPALPVLTSETTKLANKIYGRNRFYLEWLLPEATQTKDWDAIELLCNAFAGGMDSPLALELRDKRGLVYESGLLDWSRVSTLGTRITLELPVPSDQYEEIRTTVFELLKNMPHERLVTTLSRWQIGRESSFYYPTQTCVNLGTELVLFGRPKTLHECEEETDNTDIERVEEWRQYLLNTPPRIVQTTNE